MNRLDAIKNVYPDFAKWYMEQKLKGVLAKRMHNISFQKVVSEIAAEAIIGDEHDAHMAVALAIQVGAYLREKEGL